MPSKALYAALTKGDILTLEAYFSQSQVRANMDATEALVKTAVGCAPIAVANGELKPWIFLPWPLDNRWGRMTVLDLLVLRKRYDVVDFHPRAQCETNKNLQHFTMTTLPPDAVFAALTSGDIATLKQYFAQSDVRANVDATEAIIASNPSGGLFHLEYGDLTPWFFLPWTHTHLWDRRSLLELPLKSGQYDVVVWLFAAPRDAYMGATLTRLLLGGVTGVVDANHVEILEYLFSTGAWARIEDAQKQSSLNNMLSWVQRDALADIIPVLVAHGPDVNADLVNMPYEGTITSDQVDLLEAAGFFWVGCSVLVDRSSRTRRVHFGKNVDTVRKMIHLGVDCGKSSGYALHRAAKEGDHVMVKLLLEEGCVDFDACNRGQQTALMMAVLGLLRSHNRKGVPRLLLDAGADAARQDCQWRTARCHARLQYSFRDVEKILEAHEASLVEKNR